METTEPTTVPPVSIYSRVSAFFGHLQTKAKEVLHLEDLYPKHDVESSTVDVDDKALVDRAVNGNHALERPKNSKFMTICLILNTMIGSGVIGIPYVFLSTGIVVGVFMLFIVALLTWVGIIALIDVGIDQNILDYTDLSYKAFGHFGVWNVNVWIFIGNIGALLSYIIVIGSTSSDLLFGWGCKDEIGCGLNVTTCLFAAFVVFPICLIRVFGHLAWISLYSMCTIALVIGLVIIGGPIAGHPGTFPVQNYVPGGVLSQIGVLIFALTCSFGSFQTFTAMKTQDKKTWRECSAYAMTIGFCILFSIGVAGYLSFGMDTDGIILTNFIGDYADLFKILFLAHMCMYVPVDFTIMREHFLKMLCISKTGVLNSWYWNFVLTAFLLSVTTAGVLGIYAAGFSSGAAFNISLNFTGGLASSMTTFVLPAAFYLKLQPKPYTEPLYFWSVVIMGIIGLGIAILTPTYSFLYFYIQCPHDDSQLCIYPF